MSKNFEITNENIQGVHLSELLEQNEKRADEALKELLKYEPSDGGLADIWLDDNKDSWRYNTSNGKWYRWIDTHWKEDQRNGIKTSVSDYMKKIYIFAKEKEISYRDKQELKKLIERYKFAAKRTNQKLNSIVSLATTKLTIISDDFNNSNQMNFPRGTFNMDDFTFTEGHDPRDLHDSVLGYDYDPNADCPVFKKYLQDAIVFEKPEDADDSYSEWVTDWESIEMLQQILGYAFTNDKSIHHLMLWIHGDGGNGKTVLIETIMKLFGDLAEPIDINKIGKRNDQQIANVPGKRVLLSNESEKGGNIHEPTIKQLSDGSTITYRELYKQNSSFKSQATIIWAMNDRPYIADTGNSVWRRLRVIPFNRSFEDDPNKDTQLAKKLEAELAGIFNWAMEGLRVSRELGEIPETETSKNYKDEYRKDVNPLSQFIGGCCVTSDSLCTPISIIHQTYTAFCKASNYKPVSIRNFGSELKKLEQQSPFGLMYGKNNTTCCNILITEQSCDEYKFVIDPRYTTGEQTDF